MLKHMQASSTPFLMPELHKHIYLDVQKTAQAIIQCEDEWAPLELET